MLCGGGKSAEEVRAPLTIHLLNSGRFRMVLNATTIPLAPNSLSQIARDLRIAFVEYIHRTCTPERATMDASRKRKATTNATPSSTSDGSATKKIKLLVRVPLFIYT